MFSSIEHIPIDTAIYLLIYQKVMYIFLVNLKIHLLQSEFLAFGTSHQKKKKKNYYEGNSLTPKYNMNKYLSATIVSMY